MPVTQGELKSIAEGGPSVLSLIYLEQDSGKRAFKKCEFKESVVIDVRLASPIVTAIAFSDCIFYEDVSFTSRQQLTFNNCLFHKTASARPGGSKYQFTNCSMMNDLLLYGNNSNSAVEIAGTQVENFLNITGSYSGGLHIKQSKVNKECVMDKVLISTELILRENELARLSMTYLELTQKASFFQNAITEFTCINSKFEAGMFFIQDHFDKMLFRDNGYSILYLSGLKVIDNINLEVRRLENCEIEKCEIAGLLFSGKIGKAAHIKVSQSLIEVLSIINLKNFGLFEFIGITVNKEFRLQLSDLKKTDFINCQMLSAKWMFLNSKLNEIFSAQTDFPITVYDDNGENHPQAQLAFGQLHNAMKNMGDSVRALEYHAREIRAHYKILKWLTKPKNPFSFNFTKLNLWLNDVSSRFGRNWARAALFSFGLGGVFFYAMTLSTNKYSFELSFDWDWNLIPAYFRFMNPLRFFETELIYQALGKVELSPASYIIDFFARVFIAYGFYQTIQAFRRFGKTS